ncbi:MAG TPA: penicillin-binding protein activator [Desulfatiglandales bacterium]|nr:penicillin-binding protein activator [Desulfatiglandales bacterium]
MINGLRLGRKAIPILGMGIAFFALFSYQASYSETPVSIHQALPSPDSDAAKNVVDGEQAVNPEVIGCLLPLSGSFALYGQEVLNGVQLALARITEQGSSIQLIVKDTRGSAEEAASLVKELATAHKVISVIGPLASRSALSAAKKAQEIGVPIITLTQREGITAEGDMVFQNFLTPAVEVDRLVHKATQQMGLSRFAILYPDTHYGRTLMNLFWDKVEESGGSITAVESYKPEETDFAVEIKKMVGLYYPRPEPTAEALAEKKAFFSQMGVDLVSSAEKEVEPLIDFDAVFIPDNAQKVSLIAPQFPFHKVFRVRFLGTSLWQSPELVEQAAEYLQGAVFPSGFSVQSDSAAVKQFVALYRKTYETEPGILAAAGYDTLMFLNHVLVKQAPKTRQDLQRAMRASKDFTGISGKMVFNDRREVIKTPALYSIRGKRLVLLP